MRRDDWTPARLEKLYERIDGTERVCGIDEVGRGPIAGPVVACAIIMPKGKRIEGVTDSKKISEKKRERLYPLICQEAVALGIGIVDERTIDEINIRQATLLAMKKALHGLRDHSNQAVTPELVIIDAERIDTPIEQISVIKGDDRVYVVSCASIVAKVFRDRMMIDYAQRYPGYALEKHKGYGTRAHYNAIRSNGLLPIHRRSFIHGEDLLKNEYNERRAEARSEG